jgi:hypothetical protein
MPTTRTRVFDTQFTLPGATSTNAVQLNGSSQYLQVVGDPNIAAMTTFTIETWLNESAASAAYSNFLRLVSGSTPYGSLGNDNSHNNVNGQVFYSGANTYGGNAGTLFSNAAWHHIAFLHDAVNKVVSIYIDAQPVSFSFSQTGSGTLTGFVGATLLLGYDNSSTYTNAAFACTRIWNVIRQQSDLQAHLHAYLNPTYESGLIANWNVIEASGTTIANTVPAGATMTLVASPAWITGPVLSPFVYPVRSAALTRQLAGTRTLAV